MAVEQCLRTYKNPPLKSRRIFYFWTFLLMGAWVVAQPRLLIEKASHDFGKVRKGQQLIKEFKISNAGNQPLIISAADVACSCTQVVLPVKPILPGDSASVTVKFNTESVYGRQDRTVTLRSNDPLPATLRFKARVKPVKE
jgi:hypothetical protein